MSNMNDTKDVAENIKDISETHGFMVMCGIMYFASMVYVYNRHLKIFGYFILVFIFVVSWIFVAKNGKEYFTGFMNTQLYQMMNATSPYIIYAIIAAALISVILNSYGIGTVLKSYMDRIAQVKSYNLNLGKMRREDLFIFNTAFYASTLLLIGLIYSFSFWDTKESSAEDFTKLSKTSYAQIFAFIIAIVASILVAIYSTKFKSVKNDSLPKKNTNNEKVRGQSRFSDFLFGSSSRKPKKSSSTSSGTDLLQNVNKLNPIKLSEINQSSDITIRSYQNLIIPEGQTLTIASNRTLTIEGTVTNNGTVINNGTIENNGTYSGAAPNPRGTITGTNIIN